jgi:hypothetical protein
MTANACGCSTKFFVFARLSRRLQSRMCVSHTDALMSLIGTSRTSGDVRLESAKWAKADIDQVAVTNRNFMSTRPNER